MNYEEVDLKGVELISKINVEYLQMAIKKGVITFEQAEALLENLLVACYIAERERKVAEDGV